ncbi:CelD/BcsL family acetyltransferase involved in cellulose biosynthesis [Sphingomonas sp. F9_3S_D5_B_2]
MSAPSHDPDQTAATFAVARTIDELVALRSDWEALYQLGSPRNPFLSYDWTYACSGARERPAEPFVLTMRMKGQLVGVAPMCIERASGFRVLRFIADNRSDYLGFLRAEGSPEVEQILLKQLMSYQREWDLVLLQQLTDSYTGLHRDSLPGGFTWHRTEWTIAPYCAGEGDWDSFHKTGPSWLREMRKRRRRFAKEGGRTKCLTGAEAIANLDVVAGIEARSWKGRQQTTRLQPGAGRDLFERAFESLGQRGELQLCLAYVGDEPVAFQIDFVLPDRLWHYQCAYVEDFRRSRAGSVLAYESLEKAWNEGLREFDYLAGDEPYKRERTTASRAIYHLAGHRRTPRGWTAYGVLLAPRWRLRHVGVLKSAYQAAKSLKRRVSSN